MIISLFCVSLFIHTTVPANSLNPANPRTPAAPAQKWSTLNGNQPLVIARGGLSGVYPEATEGAIQMAMATTSIPDVVILCNLQMTKDGVGLCLTDIRLDNATNIALFDPKGQKTYDVNGKNVNAWFSVDYTDQQLTDNVILNQAIYSRPGVFDGMFPIAALVEIMKIKPPKLWLNYEAFYTQRGIKIQEFVLNAMRHYRIDFISSPEIGFLKSINGRVNQATTKVIFQLLDEKEVEPTTKQPFGSIAKDLATVKPFASGIMVPKEYIWPIKPDKYLGPPTTLVADAHKLGLEVYASGFANDLIASYNYSYDPVAEYLQFLDHDNSVDGFVTDFSSTASEAIACLSGNNTEPKKVQVLVISSNGASGVYPGSTDLAYQQAINDGADIIDCSVQMTKDGVAFCSETADISGTTTALTKFTSRTSNIPEIQPRQGIFSFDLTWSEIQTLKPQIVSNVGPNSGTEFPRNPANKNSGKFVTLSEFLELSKSKAVTGILINIKNAAYLASKKGLDIVGSVSNALSNATFDKQSTQQVMIQSDDTSVLSKYKDNPSYKRVLLIEDKIGEASTQTLDEIKKYATGVNLPKGSIITTSNSFTTALTKVVKEMKDANLTVFVHLLKNEYISLAFDYYSDPYMEISTFVQVAGVDGIVTAFPATTSRYARSPCSDPNRTENDPSIYPAKPGEMMNSLIPETRPPAEAPLPPLENVVDPPLPPVSNAGKAEPGPSDSSSSPTSPGSSHSTACRNTGNLDLALQTPPCSFSFFQPASYINSPPRAIEITQCLLDDVWNEGKKVSNCRWTNPFIPSFQTSPTKHDLKIGRYDSGFLSNSPPRAIEITQCLLDDVWNEGKKVSNCRWTNPFIPSFQTSPTKHDLKIGRYDSGFLSNSPPRAIEITQCLLDDVWNEGKKVSNCRWTNPFIPSFQTSPTKHDLKIGRIKAQISLYRDESAKSKNTMAATRSVA
ncbi:glycerophosphodiester phosphodiesterase GDPDL7-like [Senna tora]|uniref:glycerophosphodiester phosphodiesterase n=1 Tax=Senna tora TaxID=362788 RepID=A0A834W2G0_9FABA|nr:glycerophosphodiester phosphodiesterase GDPDL7-like [Senna tora]